MRLCNYTYDDIVLTLMNLGIKQGDHVFVHSNLGFFGVLEQANTMQDICFYFYKAFENVLGEMGTLMVPTFSYSFCRNQDFDVKNTKGDCGTFSEYIRALPNAYRSYDANFSIAAIGKQAEYFTQKAPNHSFGADSVWERLVKLNGKILCLNFNDGSTFIHYIEKYLNVPYRFDKSFYGNIITQDEIVRDAFFTHYVRNLDKPEDEPDCKRMNDLCSQEKIVSIECLGRGRMMCYNAVELMKLLVNTIKRRPRFLLSVEEMST